MAVIGSREGFLLAFDKSDRYNHMLGKVDRGHVSQLVDHLLRRKFDVYLGGSAVKSWTFYGDRAYNDVDLLAVGSEEDRLRLAQDLFHAEKNNGLYVPVKQIYEVKDLDKKKYLNIAIDLRFKLSPKQSVSRIIGNSLGLCDLLAPIDLSVVSRHKFQKH